MSNNRSITVKAPDGFWEDLFSGPFLFKSSYKALRINGNEIVISVDSDWDMIDEIRKLSKEHPDYEFRLKSDTSYLKTLLMIKNGRSKVIYAGYEWEYAISVIDKKEYDVNELLEFKKKLSEFYRILDSRNLNEINVEIPLDWDKEEKSASIAGLSFIVTYETGKSRFKATRLSYNYLRIEIEELNNPLF